VLVLLTDLSRTFVETCRLCRQPVMCKCLQVTVTFPGLQQISAGLYFCIRPQLARRGSLSDRDPDFRIKPSICWLSFNSERR
jgi:hypothetical protein